MITFNHEKYIRYALDSVLSQNYPKEDMEIIIGDDGSCDKTVKILKEYEQKYSFIFVDAHENMGISKNIYSIFSRCTGDYIAVLEGDDYWLDKDKLNKQLSYIINNNCIATASNMLIVDQNNQPSEGELHPDWKDHLIENKEVEKYQTDLFYPSSLMFKNIFLNSNDKYKVIRDASKWGGSHSGMINLLGFMGKIYYSSECLAVWRKVTTGGTNFSSRTKKKTIESSYDQYHKYIIYTKEFGFDYTRMLKYRYGDCMETLNDELIGAIDFKKSFFIITFSYLRSIKYLLRGGKK